MKTKTKFLVLGFFLSFIVGPFVMKSQPTICPTSGFQINNLRNCDVAVQWEVSDCSSIVCYSVYQLIQANSSVVLTCCSAGGDVSVWLLEVDGTDVSAAGSQVSGNCLGSQGVTTFGSGATSCLPVVYNMSYLTSYVDIW